MSRMKAVLRSAVSQGHAPGLVAIATDHEVLLHSSAHGRRMADEPGRMTMNTLFRSSSLLKPILAVSALRLAEDRMLDLDGRLGEVVPESLGRPGATVSIRHLLGLLAGPAASASRPMAWTRLAVERASGTRLEHYVRDVILRPLDMSDSYFTLPSSAWGRMAGLHRKAADGTIAPIALATFRVSESRYDRPTFYTTALDGARLLRALLRRDPGLLSAPGYRELALGPSGWGGRARLGSAGQSLRYHDWLSTHCWVDWEAGTGGALLSQRLEHLEQPLAPLLNEFRSTVRRPSPSRLARIAEFLNPYREGVHWHL